MVLSPFVPPMVSHGHLDAVNCGQAPPLISHALDLTSDALDHVNAILIAHGELLRLGVDPKVDSSLPVGQHFDARAWEVHVMHLLTKGTMTDFDRCPVISSYAARPLSRTL